MKMPKSFLFLIGLVLLVSFLLGFLIDTVFGVKAYVPVLIGAMVPLFIVYSNRQKSKE